MARLLKFSELKPKKAEGKPLRGGRKKPRSCFAKRKQGGRGG